VVGQPRPADKEFLALFAASKKDAAVNKRVTGLEDHWNSQRARQLRARATLAEQALAATDPRRPPWHPSLRPAAPRGPRHGATAGSRPGVWLAGAAGAGLPAAVPGAAGGAVFSPPSSTADGTPTLGHFSAFFARG
jgi:hypothetical protein